MYILEKERFRMDLSTLQSVLTIGETIAVEFNRCGNGIESDTYETVKI